MIRRGIEGDLEAVLGLEREVATAPHWGVEEYLRIVCGEGAGEAGPVRRVLLVAEIDGVVKGFSVGKAFDEEGELESVVVAEGQRRRGVGESLCRAVLAWCGELGARTVSLEVRAGGVGAIRLYERLGFLTVGRRTQYYVDPAEDAVMMRRVVG